jgi:transposase
MPPGPIYPCPSCGNTLWIRLEQIELLSEPGLPDQVVAQPDHYWQCVNGCVRLNQAGEAVPIERAE